MSLGPYQPLARTRDELSMLLRRMAREAIAPPPHWHHDTLPAFLHAMAGFVEQLDAYYVAHGEEPPRDVPWHVFADLLAGATSYE